MKEGRSLVELAKELLRQDNVKEDFVADTRRLQVVVNDDAPRMVIDGVGEYAITGHAHQQIGQHLGIPMRYYRRLMSEAPQLLQANVNHWFEQTPERRLVRTLDGEMRAFLSNRYRPLDNLDLANAILPSLSEAGADVQSCQVTPTRLYIKAVMSGANAEIPPPEGLNGPGYRHAVVVQPGVVISNSEVGEGPLSVQPAVHNLDCLNMAVWAQGALRKHHVGRVMAEVNDEIWKYMSDEARTLNDASVWAQVRDLTNAALGGSLFDDIVAELTRARSEVIPVEPVAAVERIANSRGLTAEERGGVLRHLIEGGDLTMWGLHSAVTRFSQDVDDYQRATDLEYLGGELLLVGQDHLLAVAA